MSSRGEFAASAWAGAITAQMGSTVHHPLTIDAYDLSSSLINQAHQTVPCNGSLVLQEEVNVKVLTKPEREKKKMDFQI
jgi:hypothetical protein